MESQQVDKAFFLPILNKIFCNELSEKIIQFPMIEFPANLQIGRENESFSFFPIVVKGSIRLIRYDSLKNEELIYNVNPGQSCIMSITAAMCPFKVQGVGITNEDTLIFAIPNEKSEEWMDNFKCWRTFVLGLYSNRMNDLIYQHEKVSKQKDEIFQQKKEITDSISYAQRIQKAILPSDDLVKTLLPDHFIFFKPRNIVSGDYYWLAQVDNKAIVVVADCTGHGVPGAFMSMLGISLLNQMVNTHKNFNAGNILDELRKQVKKSLRQNEENSESKDGMDLALMIFDFTKNEMEYAGAHNPLYIIHKEKLIEIKPDKMPIGIYINDERNFTSNTFHFEKGDMFYAFSDGFVDQFGGCNSKKYLTKNFKELIQKIHNYPVNKQYEILENTLTEWKGDNEQTDDITVLGIKV